MQITPEMYQFHIVVLCYLICTWVKCQCHEIYAAWSWPKHGNIIIQEIPSIFCQLNFFIFLMTSIDSTTNDQNLCVELFKATFTHQRSNHASKKKL